MVSEELLGVFCLMNDEGVIHIPKPDSGGVLDHNTYLGM